MMTEKVSKTKKGGKSKASAKIDEIVETANDEIVETANDEIVKTAKVEDFIETATPTEITAEMLEEYIKNPTSGFKYRLENGSAVIKASKSNDGDNWVLDYKLAPKFVLYGKSWGKKASIEYTMLDIYIMHSWIEQNEKLMSVIKYFAYLENEEIIKKQEENKAIKF